MKLKELLNTVKYSDVLPVLIREYDIWNETKGESMFNTLLNMEPVESDLKSITVEWVEDKWEYDGEIEDDSYYKVTGIDADNNSWALDYLPWNQIIGLEVIDNGIPKEKLIVSILLELSFHGYDEETIKSRSVRVFNTEGQERIKLSIEKQKELFDDSNY